MNGKGVKYYRFGKTEIEVGFPEEDICCRWCPLLVSYGDPRKYMCYSTKQYVLYPEYQVARDCPLVFQDKE